MDVSSIMANVQRATASSYESSTSTRAVSNSAGQIEPVASRHLPDLAEVGGKRDALGNISFNTRIWQREYDENEAITQAWSDAAMPIDVFGIRDTPLTGVSRDEYLAYRREMGMDFGVDWNQLEADMRVPGDNYASSDDALDYFAARYAVLRDRILHSQDAKERDAQIERLDNLFTDSVSKLADSMATKLDESLQKYGISGEKDTIYSSLLASFDEKTLAYAATIKENKDFASIAETENAWLASDDRYMAAALRRNYGQDNTTGEVVAHAGGKRVFTPVVDSDNLYTGTELSALNSVLSAMDHSFRYVNATASEEEIGFILGSMGLKMNVASEYGGFGEKMKSLSDRLLDNYYTSFIDASNKAIDELRNDTRITAVDHSNEAFYDEKAIRSIIAKMTDTYKTSGSVEDALRIGIEAGRASYLERQSEYDTELRYSSDKNDLSHFWKYYFSAAPGTDYSAPSISTQDRMNADWKSFLGVLAGNQNIMNSIMYSSSKINVRLDAHI